ncbi:hypothetical protein [Streptacidiphilus sp. EB129]|uniref:hypothetical protein n=1 Tax=Streptacidiphilus sp. EB129 TaxID=3156262 RepID=UPI003516DCA3
MQTAEGVAVLVEEAAAATRYLCAGAHLDEEFARKVVEEIEDEHHRAYAPTFGINIMLVHQHARQALQRVADRDTGLVVCLLVSLALQPALTLVMWVLMVFISGPPAGLDPRPARLRHPVSGQQGGGQVRVVVGAVVRLLIALAAMAIVAEFAPILPWPLVWIHGLVPDLIIGYPLLVLIPWIITWQERSSAWHIVSKRLTSRGFATGYPNGVPEGPITDGNITVYSGYSPFIGSGVELDSWSTTTRLNATRDLVGDIPPQREPWTVPVTAGELVEGLVAQLSELGQETTDSADGIAGLTVTEKLFVDGTVVRQNAVRLSGLTKAVLPDENSTPEYWIPEEIVRRYRGYHRGPIRHCLRSQVAAWGADLVLSVFLQVTVSGGTLYLESTTFLLPPVKEAYRVADSVVDAPAPEVSYLPADRAGGDDSVLGAQSVAAGFLALVSSPVRLYRALRAPARRRKRNSELLQAIKSDLTFDYGARLSLRDLASGPNYRNYFQRVDVARISRQIHLRTLDFVATTLVERDIDVSELLERRTAVYNSGVLMTGGAMHGTIVAGQGNTVIEQVPTDERAKKKK